MISFSSINAYGQNLEKHKWKNRILIIKTLDNKSKKYKEQLKEFRNSIEELIDRKLILYKIDGNDFTLTNFKNNELNTFGEVSGSLPERILKESENFEIVLIGLDGQIKLQRTEILRKEDLFKTIDSMPIRKNEIKN